MLAAMRRNALGLRECLTASHPRRRLVGASICCARVARSGVVNQTVYRYVVNASRSMRSAHARPTQRAVNSCSRDQ